MPLCILMEVLPDGTEVSRETEYGTYDDYYKRENYIPNSFFNQLTMEYDRTEGRTFKWTIYKDPNWRSRELRRFYDGTYVKLPWNLPEIEDHFAHVSIENGTQIAFTENEQKGMIDRQTKMKPGRYLTRFYPHLDSDTVRALAVSLDKNVGLRFAVTADEIETVYTHGPNSCMSHSRGDYSSPFHPVRVYGESDLQLAFLGTGELTDENFRASARCLVWPERKVFGRIYGDELRLKEALKQAGYEYGSFKGAKIKRYEHGGGFVLPYIDGHNQRANDCGTHIEIDYSGEIEADSTSGIAYSESGTVCYRCDDRIDEDDQVYMHDIGEYYCQHCADRYGFYCEGNEEHYTNANTDSTVVNGSVYCVSYVENNFNYCEATEEYVNERLVTLEDTGQNVAISYAREHCWQDPSSGEWYEDQPELEDEENDEDSNDVATLDAA